MSPFIGLVADTHGLLRPQATDALRGASHILHAGDVGQPSILAALRDLAPTTAIRGNVDHGAWAEALPETAVVDLVLDGHPLSIYLLHDANTLDLNPASAGVHVVVSGHSHQPSVVQREIDGQRVLFVNPGAAGPRRFKLPVTVGRLSVQGGVVGAKIVELRIES